jgi:uncharacterized protein YutE (UPF0331/DUF86 family)
MKKNTKLKVISAAVFLLACNGSAYAQWAVIDPANIAQSTIVAAQSTITAAKSTLSSVYNYYTMMASAANGQGIQETTQAVNLMQKQSVINLQTQDMMNRKALGDNKLADIAYQLSPSLSACAEASGNADNAPKNAAGRSAVSGGGGGPHGTEARSKAVTSTIAAQAALLKDQKALGTCISELEGSAGCTGNGDFAGADMHPRGIKGNVKGIPRGNEDGAAYNNYTLDSEAFKVAKKYAADMAYYDKPKVPTKTQLEKNPTYAAMYKSVQTKLDASHDTVLDIARFKKEAQNITGTAAGKTWVDIGNDEFKKVTGLNNKPVKPGMYDLVNFQVNNDYYGNEKADLKSMEEVNKRLALSNYLNWQQYKQQENTNILLAHLLTQMTTPVNKAQVDAEYTKISSFK